MTQIILRFSDEIFDEINNLKKFSGLSWEKFFYEKVKSREMTEIDMDTDISKLEESLHNGKMVIIPFNRIRDNSKLKEFLSAHTPIK